MSTRSYGTGQFGNYTVPQNEDEFHKRLRDSHDGKKPNHNKAFDKMSSEKLHTIVQNATLTNQEKHAQAISRADNYTWQATHAELLPTENNRSLINHHLQTWGIVDATYPDFQRAYDACDPSLLDLDKAELARDKKSRTYKGASGQTYYSLDDFIAGERQASIENIPAPSADEEAFEDLPQEQALSLIKQLEHQAQHINDGSNAQLEADAWISTRPDYFDSPRNGKLLLQECRANGVNGVPTVEQLEIADRQLQSSGLLTRNQAELDKQYAEEVKQRAAAAVAEPGSIYDKTSEEDMEFMDLAEVRRRANIVMGRR